MSSLEIVRLMTAYHHRLNRRLWDSIMTLSDEQFTADIPHSHGSIRNQTVHMAQTDGAWLRGLQGDPDARAYRLNPDDYPTRDSARALCDQTAADLAAYVAALDEAAAERQPPGLPMTVWQTLLHLVNHGTDHRAQVLRALHEAGAPTFDQDLVFHIMGR